MRAPPSLFLLQPPLRPRVLARSSALSPALAAALCSAWVASDARRTATGTDLDDGELAYGAAHVLPPGDAARRVCLLCADVRDDPAAAPRFTLPGDEGGDVAAEEDREWDDDASEESAPGWQALRARRADIGCALNSALCFMHTRADAERCATQRPCYITTSCAAR